MKKKITLIVLVLALSGLASLQATNLLAPVDEEQVRQNHRALVRTIVQEYLQTGAVSGESIKAFHISVGEAERRGIRLHSRPLRTNDERMLGAALLVNHFEQLGMGYPEIYNLRLEHPEPAERGGEP